MRLPLVAGDALLRRAFTRQPRLAGILYIDGRLAPARGHIRSPSAGSGRFLFVRPATFGVTAGECGLFGINCWARPRLVRFAPGCPSLVGRASNLLCFKGFGAVSP